MPGNAAEKAAWFGVTLPTVSRWSNGSRTPTDEATLKLIASKPGGPLPHEWELFEDAPAARPSLPPAAEMPEATPQSVQAEANRLLAMVRSATDEAWLEPDVARRLGMLKDVSSITQQLGRTVGAGHVVTERQILESPHWRLMSDRIIAALTPHPAALAAVAAALEGTSAQPT